MHENNRVDEVLVKVAGWACLAVMFAELSRAGEAELRFEPYTLETAGTQKIACEFARLRVPQRHAEPKGQQIELALVRFKSTAKKPEPPVVYLAGGPGGSGIALARGPRSTVILAMREVADVIALDQRGTGLTKPELNCRETLGYPLNRPGEPEGLVRCYEKALIACAERLRASGVDLAAYNTEESADDLESLRQALGVEKISLFGSSYGTHLGLAALRRHSERIHRAILSGVEGPDQTLKLPNNIQQQLLLVSQLASADGAVRRKIPDLMGLVASVLNKLEQKPAFIPVVDPETKQGLEVAVGKFDLQQATAGFLGTRDGKSSIPALYYNLSIENYASAAVQAMARDVVEQRTGSIGSAMGFAMDCASGASAGRRRMIQEQAHQSLLGGDIDFPIPQVCAACGLVELPDSFRAPLQCAVPALFISGSLDGRTPPGNAEEVRQGFSNGRHVILEGAGHGNELFISSPRIKELLVEFMKTGKVTADTIPGPPMQFKEF